MNVPQILIKKACVLGACFLLMLLMSCKTERQYVKVTETTILEEVYKKQLQMAIINLDSLLVVKSLKNKQFFYQKARTSFKQLEPVLAFTDKSNYKSLNAPNILKVEEEDATDIKINAPFGFQVIEELLYDDEVNEKQINQAVNKTKNRLGLIESNAKLNLKKYHVLWLLRDAIVRVAVTGITGFDSPVLEQSLQESDIIYTAIEKILATYKGHFTNQELLEAWQTEIQQTKTSLQGNFNTFDRYHFIKNHTHKQLKLLVKTQKDWQVIFPFELAFKNDMTSLFSSNTFNVDFFSDYIDKSNFKKEKIALGEQLFNDKQLSINKDMSCATCHHKEKAFTDGLKTFPKQTRNTPTVTYAALQQSFFYDGRAGSLEGQVAAVVKNKNEFHSDLETMKNAVKNDSTYVNSFNKIYKGKINSNTVRHAIATYIRSLNKFNSKFDNNINNKENTITKSEINGFNLFTGKAKCATCHFAPVFNGTVPPNFTETEFELLGVPNDTLNNSVVSNDLGRYNLFKTANRKHFFKTSTVRNIAKTAPYMHNGVFETLAQVIDFYNKGGGNGLGFNLRHQTLPVDELNLTEKEIKELVAFMETLTDN